MEIPQIVRSYVEAWQAKDLDGYLATFAADGTYSGPLLAHPTQAHELREHFAGYFAPFPDSTCETEALMLFLSNSVYGDLSSVAPTQALSWALRLQDVE